MDQRNEYWQAQDNPPLVMYISTRNDGDLEGHPREYGAAFFDPMIQQITRNEMGTTETDP